ncbi:type II toxin-antitoxin system RelE/ParE family toxin [Rhizobium binae]|uniref:type II toxin-antitoxin system RelE/ParE family toxin n=1 Tax=Rhizobium binae TaxID=1138190 RepID=UPI001441CEB3|nr:type II toxin-antitoxin system RelE/ParE family toxin [Rhizobium binae]MBX4971027.1 type II toxin-antitoxin system RelE/ParE family toxin [Rhizobium binae]MBX4994934.1 type II toxin-antitoxin system RelE/ParE family toxin [Rhizobium binae]NKL52581.1 type II toxin-antitoxin system RelE/ParE family toxin [Rhizobium leguminosarum bv. viciae]
MTAYILTAEAESDLRSVIRYTRAQWSAAQVCRLSALYPALRMAKCEHHHVLCLLREDAPALVVAILHERMDLMKRLAG